MKKRIHFLIALVSVLLITVACSNKSSHDDAILLFAAGEYELAKQTFMDWAQAEADSDSVGILIGSVNAGDIVGSETIGSQKLSSERSTQLKKNGWVFYLDEAPGAFYSHPGKILVIDEDGEIIHQTETNGWPTVNGETPETMKKPLNQMA